MGSNAFREELKKDLRERGAELEQTTLPGADPASWREERAADWEEKLRAAAQREGVDLAALPARKSASQKVRLAAIMEHFTAGRPVIIGELSEPAGGAAAKTP